MNLFSQSPLFMGLFDFFKGKKQEQKVIIDVRLEDLDNVINEKKEELSGKEKELLLVIKKNKDSLINDLQEKIIILENIDLNHKKVEERIRLIVKENLFYFISNLKKLIGNVKDLETEDLNKFVEELNKKFFDFEKKSLINYEKATFLIGKELGSVKDCISVFFRNLNNIINENKEIFENLKIINNIEGKLKELKESNERKNQAEKNIQDIENKISELTKENESFERVVNKIKKSEDYKEEIDSEIMLNEKNQQYEKELLKFREMIDFKSLANVFHSNEKTMDKLKCYKNSFKETFESNNQTIIDLLKEAGIENNQLLEKKDRLNKEKENLLNLRKNKKETEIKHVLNIQFDIKNNKSEIENLNKEKAKENKLIQKFDETNKEHVEELRKELIKVNFNLIE